MSESSPEQRPATPEEIEEAKLTIQAFAGDEAAQDRIRVEQAAAAHKQVQDALAKKARQQQQEEQ